MSSSARNKKSGGLWSKGNAKIHIYLVVYNFEGAKTEIGAVLDPKYEKIKHKVIFNDFIDKFTYYLTF